MTCHQKGPEGQNDRGSGSSPNQTSDEEAVTAFITAINLDSPGPKSSRKDRVAKSVEDTDNSLIQVSAQILRHALIGQAQKVKTDAPSSAKPQLLPLAERILRLDDALIDLAKYDQDKARMVELCYFGGMQKHDVANVLGWSEERFQKEWLFTKAWLKRQMGASRKWVDTTAEKRNLE